MSALDISTPSRFANQRYEPGPEVNSYYHLRDCDLSRRPCAGTACFVARSSRADDSFRAEPKDEPETPHVYCLGRCFESPASGLSETRPHIEIDSRNAIVLARLAAGGARTFEAYSKSGGYRAAARALVRSPAEVLEAVERSGLRGRGGAGFPTGRKWRAAAHQASFPKYLVANGDEGDAGAYLDRFLMEDDPHALIEGMIIAAYAIGASRGWIYLRHEYPSARTAIERAITETRNEGLLGARIFGTEFSFDLEVFVGHGSYVCGEETSLMRSLEGRRPEVSARPPYPTEHGLLGQPTITNNIETLVSLPWIIEHGGDAYYELGFSRSRGTKVVSLNSLFVRPGLYEVEFGVSVRHLVEDLGGGLHTGTLKGLLIGGPLAGIIPPHLLDTPFGFEELGAIGASVGHGGIVAFDEHTSIASLVHHVFSFGAYESCGKCTPCRLGSRRVEEIFSQVAAIGRQSSPVESELRDIIRALKWTSLCGHGTGLGAFAESALLHYGEELAACFP